MALSAQACENTWHLAEYIYLDVYGIYLFHLYNVFKSLSRDKCSVLCLLSPKTNVFRWKYHILITLVLFAYAYTQIWKSQLGHNKRPLESLQGLFNFRKCKRFCLNFVFRSRPSLLSTPLMNTEYMWAGPWENVSYVKCEQQRRRSACASAQSDQRLCCSLLR